MDKQLEETLALANKAIDQTNELNKHIISCVTLILCIAFIMLGAFGMYATHKIYDYEAQPIVLERGW